jgi:hypothetical protein
LALIEGLLGIVEEVVAILTQLIRKRHTCDQDVSPGVLANLSLLVRFDVSECTMRAETSNKWQLCHLMTSSFRV